jgi:hypothetical protein
VSQAEHVSRWFTPAPLTTPQGTRVHAPFTHSAENTTGGHAAVVAGQPAQLDAAKLFTAPVSGATAATGTAVPQSVTPQRVPDRMVQSVLALQVSRADFWSSACTSDE